MSVYCSQCDEDAWFPEGCSLCSAVLCDDCQDRNEGYCKPCYTSEPVR